MGLKIGGNRKGLIEFEGVDRYVVPGWNGSEAGNPACGFLFVGEIFFKGVVAGFGVFLVAAGNAGGNDA